MSIELRRLTTELECRLPEHTFKAIIRRADGRDSDEARRSLLADVLSEREQSEAADQTEAAA